MRNLNVAVLLAVVAAISLAAAERRPIKAIYIGTVVQGSDNDSFRAVLRGELRKAGFRVTETSDDADAVLSGEVSEWSETSGTFSAALVSPEGVRLWQGAVPRPMKLRKTRCDDRDTSTALAQNLADAVRKAARRSR